MDEKLSPIERFFEACAPFINNPITTAPVINEKADCGSTPEITKHQQEYIFTDAQIKHMRDRFLGWKLPESFNPDGGISFSKKPYNHINEPYGTNVFDAQQAEEMVRYMLEGLS